MSKKIMVVLTLVLIILSFTAFNKQTENQNEELILKSIASIPEENIYLCIT